MVHKKFKNLKNGHFLQSRTKIVLIKIKFAKFWYSSVPNRRAVQNKRADGKTVSKSINVQTKIRLCRGEFFLKINKRADQNKTAAQEKIDVQGGKCSQNQ